MEDYPMRIGGDQKLCARVDISKASKVEGVELGEEVTLVIKGKVKSMRGPEERLEKDYMAKDPNKAKEKEIIYPGSIEIEVSSMKVEGVSEFADMEDEED